MSAHVAEILWHRNSDPFLDNQYQRQHTWKVNDRLSLPASASTQIIPPPLTSEDAIDPEQAYVASLASCHMLWFLAFAQKSKLLVDEYRDTATGYLAKNASGKMAITKVILRPQVTLADLKQADDAMIEKLHHRAHGKCFIAQSVKTDIVIEPVPV